MTDIASIQLVHAPSGHVHTVEQLTTMFDLVLLVVDAHNPVATSRILQVYSNIDRVLGDADVNLDVLVVGAAGADAVEISGQLASRSRVFEDPDGSTAAKLGVTVAPTLLWINLAPTVCSHVEGWLPDQWRPVIKDLAKKLAWTRPLVPDPKDPAPFVAEPFHDAPRDDAWEH